MSSSFVKGRFVSGSRRLRWSAMTTTIRSSRSLIRPETGRARQVQRCGQAFGMVAASFEAIGIMVNIAICHAAAPKTLGGQGSKAAAANDPDFGAAVDCLVLGAMWWPADSGKVKQLSREVRRRGRSRNC